MGEQLMIEYPEVPPQDKYGRTPLAGPVEVGDFDQMSAHAHKYGVPLCGMAESVDGYLTGYVCTRAAGHNESTSGDGYKNRPSRKHVAANDPSRSVSRFMARAVWAEL